MQFISPTNEDDQSQEDEFLFVIPRPILYLRLQVEGFQVLSVVVFFIVSNNVLSYLVLQ